MKKMVIMLSILYPMQVYCSEPKKSPPKKRRQRNNGKRRLAYTNPESTSTTREKRAHSLPNSHKISPRSAPSSPIILRNSSTHYGPIPSHIRKNNRPAPPMPKGLFIHLTVEKAKQDINERLEKLKDELKAQHN